MDVLDFLREVPDGSVDLLVADPPYNMSKEYWDTFKTHADFMNFTKSWLDAAIPKLTSTGSIYVFNNPFNTAFILAHLYERGLHYKNTIIWNKKDGMTGGKRRFIQNQEQIVFFTRNEKQYVFNADDVREPYESVSRIAAAAKKGILKNGKRWFPNENGKLCTDVWHYSSERHKNKVGGRVVKSEHVTPKPKDLISRIILASSNEGQTVMDPFGGLGTTAIVAKSLSRGYIINDFDLGNYEIMLKNLQ